MPRSVQGTWEFRWTFQVRVHLALFSPGALATIVVLIFRPAPQLGLAFTVALLGFLVDRDTALDFLLTVIPQLAAFSLPFRCLPFTEHWAFAFLIFPSDLTLTSRISFYNGNFLPLGAASLTTDCVT